MNKIKFAFMLVVVSLLIMGARCHREDKKPPLCPDGKPDTCEYPWPPQDPPRN